AVVDEVDLRHDRGDRVGTGEREFTRGEAHFLRGGNGDRLGGIFGGGSTGGEQQPRRCGCTDRHRVPRVGWLGRIEYERGCVGASPTCRDRRSGTGDRIMRLRTPVSDLRSPLLPAYRPDVEGRQQGDRGESAAIVR